MKIVLLSFVFGYAGLAAGSLFTDGYLNYAIAAFCFLLPLGITLEKIQEQLETLGNKGEEKVAEALDEKIDSRE